MRPFGIRHSDKRVGGIVFYLHRHIHFKSIESLVRPLPSRAHEVRMILGGADESVARGAERPNLFIAHIHERVHAAPYDLAGDLMQGGDIVSGEDIFHHDGVIYIVALLPLALLLVGDFAALLTAAAAKP